MKLGNLTNNTKWNFMGSFFLRFHLFTFREKGREGERKGEKHQCVVASCMLPTWGPGPKPGHMS